MTEINFYKNDLILLLTILFGILLRYTPQIYYDIINRYKKPHVKKNSIFKARYIVYLYSAVIIGFLLNYGSYHNSISITILGFSIFLFGLIIGFAGLLALNHQYSEHLVCYPNATLVTDGIYGIVRNPIRIGLTMELFGIAVLSNIYLMYILVIVVNILQFMRTKDEEMLLAQYFGDTWEKYQFNVPRFNVLFGFVRFLSNTTCR